MGRPKSHREELIKRPEQIVISWYHLQTWTVWYLPVSRNGGRSESKPCWSKTKTILEINAPWSGYFVSRMKTLWQASQFGPFVDHRQTSLDPWAKSGPRYQPYVPWSPNRIVLDPTNIDGLLQVTTHLVLRKWKRKRPERWTGGWDWGAVTATRTPRDNLAPFCSNGAHQSSSMSGSNFLRSHDPILPSAVLLAQRITL